MLKKILKFLLIVFLLGLLAAVVVGGALLLGRSLVEGLYALAALALIWLLFTSIRRFILRRRAKAQVERMITQQQPDAAPAAPPRSMLRAMRERWRRGLKTLRQSELRRHGDPVYVLPWFMIVGRPRSGKSTALRNARLLSPVVAELPEHDDGQTANLDWWLYEEAIVIDTAGRYAVPDDPKRDRREWEKLLAMVARRRQREPLNGVIVVIAANRLQECKPEELLEEGRQVRASIVSLLERLEAQLPVYLLVTKSDLIPGFTDWVEHLPAGSLDQAMGCLVERPRHDAEAALDDCLDSIVKRLRDLRLVQLDRVRDPGDALVRLPDTVADLRSGLHYFVQGALKANPYQETPRFRGLFFSSSRQALGQDGVFEERGLFLRDLFTRILPGDRGLLESLPAAARLRSAARAFGVSLTVGVLMLVAALASAQFVADRGALLTLLSAQQPITAPEATLDARLSHLVETGALIDGMEVAVNDWRIPWYGPGLAPGVLRNLQKDFASDFQQSLLQPLAAAFTTNQPYLAGDPVSTSIVAGGLVRRINLLRARLAGADVATLEGMSPATPDYVRYLLPDVSYATAQYFNTLYVMYLRWQPDSAVLQQELDALRADLAGVLAATDGQYDWLVAYVNLQQLPAVTLEEFWPGTAQIDNPPTVPAAYTLTGRDTAQAFVADLIQAASPDLDGPALQTAFNDWYAEKYIGAWYAFADNFKRGTERLRNRNEWQQALSAFTDERSPYFQLLGRMNTELAPFADLAGDYPALTLIQYFTDVQSFQATAAGGGGSGGLAKLGLKFLGKAGKVGKALSKVGKTALKVQKKTGIGKGGGPDPSELEQKLEKAATTFGDYKKALDTLAFNADQRGLSLDAMQALYQNPEDPGAGNSPLSAGWKAVRDFQALIARPNPDTRFFWELYSGPLNAVVDYLAREGACRLQQQWEDTVLAELAGVAKPDQRGAMLVGDGGLVWKYVEGPAAPFLNKRFQKGYLPADFNGTHMPFTDAFMTFLGRADTARQLVAGQFSVTVTGLPTGINKGAQLLPAATTIELQCADGVQTLENYNFPATQVFNWSSQSCGTTRLRIRLGTLTLEKVYAGPSGFGAFLGEFRTGQHFYTPQDFPDKAGLLKQAGVKEIAVNYRLQGAEPVVLAGSSIPSSAPAQAVACW